MSRVCTYACVVFESLKEFFLPGPFLRFREALAVDSSYEYYE